MEINTGNGIKPLRQVLQMGLKDVCITETADVFLVELTFDNDSYMSIPLNKEDVKKLKNKIEEIITK